MLRPRKIKRLKMGLRDMIAKIFRRHRRWTKGFGCAVEGCLNTDMEFAHIRNAANAGMKAKPHDAFGYGLCGQHHREEHGGAETFWRKYGIDPYARAAWFLRNSPDIAMRESLNQLPEHVKRPLLEAA